MLSSLLVLSSQNIVYYDSTLYVTELHVLNSQHSCSPTEIVYPLAYVAFEGNTFISEGKRTKLCLEIWTDTWLKLFVQLAVLYSYINISGTRSLRWEAVMLLSFFLFVVLVQNGHEDVTNYTQHSESGVILTLFQVLVSLSLVKTSKQDVGL